MRESLNHAREKDQQDKIRDEIITKEEPHQDIGRNQCNMDNKTTESRLGKTNEEGKINPGICRRCGKIGHKYEEFFKPLVCPRCKKEGHFAKACPEVLPWECIVGHTPRVPMKKDLY